MSESQRATEIVQSALHTLHELGVPLHASRETLARLAETARLVAPAAPAAPAASRPAAPEQRPASAPDHTAEPRTESRQSAADLAAAFAARMAESPSTAAPRQAPASPAHSEPAPHPTPTASSPSSSAATRELPGATHLAPATGTKAERLAAMRPTVLACTKCPHLVRARKQVVFGVGNPEAQLMFVGEAPGADEDLLGEPFVGRAGQLLTKIIETMGLRRSDVFIANILKCRPNMPEGEPGNRKPTPEEMSTCKPYVLEQINIIQPRVLVALGGTSVEGLLNIEKAGITRMRGQWRDFHGIPLMPTFHPSFLLRPSADQQANKRLVWEDMLSVMEKLGMPISERQRGFFLAKG